MSERRCRHEFYRIVFFGMATWWKCIHCGIKIQSREDAEMLEG